MQDYPRGAMRNITQATLALILAGGRGTRMGALTSHRAKPAVHFGGKFRLIDFPLSNCINSGIRRVGILTQYKSHSLNRHIERGWNFLHGEFDEYIELLPAQQRRGPAWYRGTADAVYQNFGIIKTQARERVLILGGDHVYKMDYADFLGFHVKTAAELSVGCVDVPVDQADQFGVATLDADDRITAFREKPKDLMKVLGSTHVMASMGIYVFDKDYLQKTLTEDAGDPQSSHDFGKDILPRALARGDRVYGFPFRDIAGNRRGYWRDVGNLDAYWQANLELVDVVPPLDLYDRDWPIWTYQVQAPPCKFVFDDDSRRGMAVDSMLAGGCVISGGHLRRSVLFPFVRVEESSLVEESVILPDVVIGPHCSIRRAVVEAGCRIEAGSEIGMNPEDDHRRFEVSPGGIVLVTPEMLNQEFSPSR